jgi:copper/silver efflux system protein
MTILDKIILFFLENRLITFLLFTLFIIWGVVTAPFNWDIDFLPRDPVPVDAIPDIGENQQIVFTEWMGRSPADVEEQITYPLTASLLGMPGVKSVRSTSMFGFSSIYIIFDDSVEYYWSRTRVLEKLSSLPPSILPEGVAPTLGPDATALGQIFWYTLEGRDENGSPSGGWDLHELRTIQDFYVRYGLNATEGVSEVASIGGFVKEYQIDLDPLKMKSHNINIMHIAEAVRKSNLDIGANTVEMNLVEYYVRGLGYIRSLEDIEHAVVKVTGNVPVRIKDIATVNIGPAPRGHGGFLDKGGAEAVGGVVVARYGENPLKVIQNVKERIKTISQGLPSKQLPDGTISKVTIVPFYDRTELIYETLGTLYEAISLQILIAIIVIIFMVLHLRASLMISSLLPIAVLMVFVFMKYSHVDANIVALSGIAIAIGTLIDLGIILTENILRHKDDAPPGQAVLTTVFNASREVASAIITAVATTIVSFLPVFTLQEAEGKLFSPLAFTKTFALSASLIVTLFMIPALAYTLLSIKPPKVVSKIKLPWKSGNFFLKHKNIFSTIVIALGVSWLLAEKWRPLGVDHTAFTNFLFVLFIIGFVLGFFRIFIHFYPKILLWTLEHKKSFLLIPLILIVFGMNIWLGFNKVFAVIPETADKVGWNIRTNSIWSSLSHSFPGIGKEFMPSLDEGSFLLMPTSMPHSGVEVNIDYLRQLDMRVQNIPEVETVVGKAGRVDSALDPAPLSMFENIIIYKSEYKSDENGYPIRFKTDKEGKFLKDTVGNLIPDKKGKYFRQWRDHIKTPDDIWNEITTATRDIPGVTSAPKLQPIETRLVMLQTGMRAPMGVKVFGPDLESIEYFSMKMEQFLKEVPSVKSEAVYADRSLGKPYIEIEIDRKKIARHGLSVEEVQMHIELAIGGMNLTSTVEGRERFNVRARYSREWRDDPESMKRILVSAPTGAQIPLGDLAEIQYRSGPMMIRGENSFPVGYVMLDKKEGFAEVSVVEQADNYLKEKIKTGELIVPPGVNYEFSGNYENQIRAEKRLMLIVPLVLVLIFLILYFQFRSTATVLMVFSAIALSFAGGFIMLWLYSQDWFMNFSIFDMNIREMFQIHSFNLSVAVWVGFIALFGIATDDGVVIATYIKQNFEKNKPGSVDEIRKTVLESGMKRIRPCLMTTATTLIALLPVLTSTGRGSDIMIPMAIPTFGGMTIALITLFIVPVLFSAKEEFMLKRRKNEKKAS